MAKPAITIRLNWGSRAILKRVFAFDPNGGPVLAVISYPNNVTALAALTIADLEAIDAKGKYHDVAEVLTKRAEYILIQE